MIRIPSIALLAFFFAMGLPRPVAAEYQAYNFSVPAWNGTGDAAKAKVPAAAAKKTASDAEVWQQLFGWVIVLGVLFTLVGGFLGLNIFVLGTFIGVVILVSILQWLLALAGLSFGFYGFFVTFVLAISAALLVMMKTS